MAEENDLTASALIHRDMGRLEGRMSALESRVARNEETVDRGFSLVGEKLDRIERGLQSINERDALADGKAAGAKSIVKGGWSVIVAIGSFIATAAMAVVTFLRH